MPIRRRVGGTSYRLIADSPARGGGSGGRLLRKLLRVGLKFRNTAGRRFPRNCCTMVTPRPTRAVPSYDGLTIYECACCRFRTPCVYGGGFWIRRARSGSGHCSTYTDMRPINGSSCAFTQSMCGPL